MTVKLKIGLQVQISLHVADRENVAYLWSNSDNLRLKGLQYWKGADVRSDLFVEVADRPDLPLLRQELGSAPIQVPINSVLIIGAGVDEISSKAGHHRKFVACLWIEIRIAHSAVYCPMANAEVGQV